MLFMSIKKQCLSYVFLIISLIFLSGCVGQPPEGNLEPTNNHTTVSNHTWMDIELKDVKTGKTFRIRDFEDKPVLLESFAVWCPTCVEQQREIKKLNMIDGDSIIHISLDTDPNEDENKVLEHIERHDFDWYFAVSPIELTMELIDDFGFSIINAPGVPMVLICENKDAILLRSGVKRVAELQEEVKIRCQ